MGYTHKWRLKPEATDRKTTEIGEDILTMMMLTEIPVARHTDHPDQPPQIDENHISFNGVGDDMCEDFRWPPPEELNRLMGINPGTDWCKTERRPYDVLVAAALISIKHHLGPNVETGSDGRLDEEEWKAAISLYRRAFPDRHIPAGITEDYSEGQAPLLGL